MSRAAETVLRRRLTIGQTWRRRADGALAEVTQVHRADRLAELELDGRRRRVLFADLLDGWDQLVPASSTRTTRTTRHPRSRTR